MSQLSQENATSPAATEPVGDDLGLFTHMTHGIMHCRVVADAEGRPVDYIVEAINPAYERILGRRRADVIGKPITSIYPGVHSMPLDPILTLGHIGLHGGQGHFEQFIASSQQRLSIFAYSPRPGEFVAIFTDITAQREAEATTQESERRYRALFNNRSHPVAECRIITDAAGQPVDYIHVAVNDEACRVMERPRAELVGRPVTEVFPGIESVEPNLIQTFGRVALSGEDVDFDVNFGPTGQWFSVYAYSPTPGEFIALFTDISEARQRDASLRERDQVLRVTFEHAALGIAHIGPDSRFLRVNPCLCQMLGYGESELIGHWIKEITYAPDRNVGGASLRDAFDAGAQTFTMEKRLQHRNGNIIWVQITVSPVRDPETGTLLHYISLINDISAAKTYESKLAQLAHYDALTGLVNRSLLMDRLRHAMAASKRNGQTGALLFLDLDHFKSLNDTLGHELGDQLLQQVAARLRTTLRENDTVARLGGDEFVVLQDGLSENLKEAAAQATGIAEKILATFAPPILLGAHEQFTTPSVGIVLFQGHEKQAGEILQHAELAMYQAKTAGRNTFRFFDTAMQHVANARATLEADLRHGLQHQEFLLHYQPQVSAEAGMIGVEALVRWLHPQRGLVPPVEFIPLAEETGQILALGRTILETACLKLAAWATSARTAQLEMAVNISARQFHHPDFVAEVLSVVKRTGANPQRLKLELTESLLLTNVDDVICKMNQLRAHGILFSLDDFGTGYSSLAYLKRLPLHQLKIDQSFVRDVLTDANDAAIAKSIIALGHSLGLSVIAEGVETEGQLDFLRENGCHAYQGYLYSRPLSPDDIEAFIARHC